MSSIRWSFSAVAVLVFGLSLFFASASPALAQEAPSPILVWSQGVEASGSDELASLPYAQWRLGELGALVHRGSQSGVWLSDGTRAGTRLALPGFYDFGGASGSTFYALDQDLLWAVTPGGPPRRPVARFPVAQDWRSFYLGAVPERGLIFFQARQDFSFDPNLEPWVSDGTVVGTRPLGDLRSGDEGSNPYAGVGIGHLFLFAANDDSGGLGVLYATDGTQEGTRPIRTDADGTFFSRVGLTVRLGDEARAVFTAVDGSGNRGLYVSDGTESGTVRLTGLSGGGPITRFHDLLADPEGGQAWFVFQRGELLEVWTTDGTVAGTRKVGETPGTVERRMAAYEDGLYVLVERGATPRLWRSGTTADSFRSLHGDAGPSFTPWFLLTGPFGAEDTDRFYFGAADDETGTEIWHTDGTVEGTGRVADLCPGPCNGAPTYLEVVGEHTLAPAPVFPDDSSRRRLFAIDGETPRLLADLPETAVGFRWSVTGGDDFALWSVAEDDRTRLWTTDGTPAGTRPLDPILPSRVGGPLRVLTEHGGGAVFLDWPSSLWWTDGTPSGTRRLWQDETPTATSVFPLVSVGDTLVFVQPGPNGRVWVSDGTASGTRPGDLADDGLPLQVVDGTVFSGLQPIDLDDGHLLPPLVEDTGRIDSLEIDSLDGRFYFAVNGELFSSDGTQTGTVAELPALSRVSGLRRVGDVLVFSAEGDDPIALRVWDPASGELRSLEKDPSSVREALVAGGRYLFTDSRGLFIVDRGLTSIEQLVERPEAGFGPLDLMALGDLVVFTDEDTEHGLEVWRTDGTVAGTGILRDLAPGPADSEPEEMRVAGDRLVFEAWTPATGRELFVSDGTAEGTGLLVDHVPGTLEGRRFFRTEGVASLGGGLLYAAWSPDVGSGVWLLGSDIEQDPAPPAGPWLTSARVPGFRFKVRITDQQGGTVTGVQEPGCIEETLCVSGALAGRSEVFLRVVGPKPNGFLWPTLAKFTTSQVEVWVEREDGGERRYYLLPGATAGGPDLLPALFDRQGFPAVAGKTVGEPLRWGDATERLEPGEPEIPAGSEGIVSAAVPGFRFHVRLTSQAGDGLPTREEAVCIDETVCVSGAVPGRSELFLRVIGPRPNGFLWPTLVRFTTSEVEVWVEQLSTGETRYYRLPAASPGSESLDGLFDRQGFR